jgi:hypothetical protein
VRRPVWPGPIVSGVVGFTFGVTGAIIQAALALPALPTVGLWMLVFAAAWLILGALNRLGMLR